MTCTDRRGGRGGLWTRHEFDLKPASRQYSILVHMNAKKWEHMGMQKKISNRNAEREGKIEERGNAKVQRNARPSLVFTIIPSPSIPRFPLCLYVHHYSSRTSSLYPIIYGPLLPIFLSTTPLPPQPIVFEPPLLTPLLHNQRWDFLS